ncbi:unnamed protein product [Leuciscus chuanchicus]
MSTNVETQRAPSRRKWTVDKEERLVELWAEQPCLFDVNCHSYHDRVEKEKKWTDIAEAIDMPGLDGFGVRWTPYHSIGLSLSSSIHLALLPTQVYCAPLYSPCPPMTPTSTSAPSNSPKLTQQ